MDLWLIQASVSWLIQASISRLYQPNPHVKYGWFNYEATQGIQGLNETALSMFYFLILNYISDDRHTQDWLLFHFVKGMILHGLEIFIFPLFQLVAKWNKNLAEDIQTLHVLLASLCTLLDLDALEQVDATLPSSLLHNSLPEGSAGHMTTWNGPIRLR